MMKKFIMWLFRIKPEIRYIDRVITKDKELPKGSILMEADHIKIGELEMGIE